jgi:hypothetical protein
MFGHTPSGLALRNASPVAAERVQLLGVPLTETGAGGRSATPSNAQVVEKCPKTTIRGPTPSDRRLQNNCRILKPEARPRWVNLRGQAEYRHILRAPPRKCDIVRPDPVSGARRTVDRGLKVRDGRRGTEEAIEVGSQMSEVRGRSDGPTVGAERAGGRSRRRAKRWNALPLVWTGDKGNTQSET